jgi:hypothetical protein
LQKFRIVVAMKIYPGALRGLCSTLKDKIKVTLQREPQARNR